MKIPKDGEMCSIEGCNYEPNTKGLCTYHYWASIRKMSYFKSKGRSHIIKGKQATKIRNRERNKRESLYRKARKEYLAAHHCCEARLEGCTIPTSAYDSSELQIHHKKGRNGRLMYDKKYFIAVCFNCHRIIEENPEFAKAADLSVSRLAS